jgi:hypothetical protein
VGDSGELLARVHSVNTAAAAQHDLEPLDSAVVGHRCRIAQHMPGGCGAALVERAAMAATPAKTLRLRIALGYGIRPCRARCVVGA